MIISKDLIKPIGLVFMIMSLSIIAGFFYVKNVKPVYEAKAYLSRATPSDLANFSYSLSDLLPPLTESQIYNIFVKNLNSQATKQSFFKEKFLPSLPPQLLKKEKIDSLYRRFNTELIIRNDVTQGRYSGYRLMVKNTDPEQATRLLQDYIHIAKIKTRNDIIHMIENQNKSIKIKLAQKIELLRNAAKQEKNDRLIKLREALKIAQAGAINEPIPTPKETAFIALNMNEQTEPGTIYMRGAKAIEAEIANIMARESDDSFIPGLRILQSEYEAVQHLTINPHTIKPFRLEGKIDIPQTPIYPNATLILFLALLIGGLLSGLCVLSIRPQSIIKTT